MRTMAEKKLSEVRWHGHGVFQIGNSTFSYSGVPEHEKSYRRQEWRLDRVLMLMQPGELFAMISFQSRLLPNKLNQ